jgi:di/tricarboxylate transporter
LLPGHLTGHELSFLVILFAAIILLVTERLQPAVIALLIILALYLTQNLTSVEALSGFGSEPAIVIASVFVLSAALEQTGLADLLGEWIGRLAGSGLTRMTAVLMPAAALLSAFTHHVAIIAILLPVSLGLAEQRKIAPSRVLMPMAIGSSLGTTLTIVGAPSFLVASALLRQAGRPGLHVFSIAPIGIVLTIVGTLFILALGRILLPERTAAADASDHFRLAEYLTELTVLPGSTFEGKTPEELETDTRYDFTILARLRDGRRSRDVDAREPLQSGDTLLVRAPPEELLLFREDSGLELRPVVQYGAEVEGVDEGGEDVAGQLVQVVVAPDSPLVGQTIGEIDFRRRYGGLVLGLWRRTGWSRQELARTRLREGDVLVLQGDDEALQLISRDRSFLMMVPFHGEARRHRKAILAGAIIVASIALAALDKMTLSMAMLTGAIATVLTGCLTVRQAYRSIDVSVYIFLAGAIPLGLAMNKSGSAKLLANWLRSGVAGWDQHLVLLALFLVVAVVVQFMGSDSATTALLGPVAIALAAALRQAPEAYVVTVAMAAVTAMLTPLSHHNLLIYGAGGYRFSDFLRVGAPLTLLLALVVVWLAPVLWRA